MLTPAAPNAATPASFYEAVARLWDDLNAGLPARPKARATALRLLGHRLGRLQATYTTMAWQDEWDIDHQRESLDHSKTLLDRCGREYVKLAP